METLDQSKRLCLTQTMVEMIKEIRSMSEVEILGHLVGFYVYATQQTGGTLENALEAVRQTWEEPSPKVVIDSLPDFDEYCPAEKMANGEFNVDHSHCQCWYDGDGCCRCKAAPMTEEQKRAQGMIE